MRARWYVLRDADTVTVSRSLPVRWDVSAETRFPAAGRLRLAHQVRQDLWRALQSQRGFAPVVAVTSTTEGCILRAGGRVAAAHDRKRLENSIIGVLNAPENRARWLRFAPSREQTMTSPIAVNETGLAGEGAF